MGKYVVKQAKSGFMFNLKAGNGEIIATSEVYSSEDACRAGIESVKKAAAAANLEDQTVEGFAEQKHPKFEVYNDKAGQFRFRLKAVNGQIVVTGEAYTSKSGCMGGIDSIKRNIDSPVE